MATYNVGSSVSSSYSTETSEEPETVDDLTIVPLGKESFVICEFCGRVGRREHFCLRNNNFCSTQCFTSSVRKKHRYNWKFKLMEGTEHMEGLIPLEPLPQIQQWQATLTDLQAGPIKPSAAMVANSYEWKDELFGCDFLAAPVSLFKHAPLHEMWDSTFEGLKVEVRNTDCENYSEKLGDYFWVATVLKVKGYMGLLRYEGFGSDTAKDFWVNLCCSEVHPVGWCATRGKPLIPPRTIEDKYTDWKKFLVKQLTGARTLPANFYNKLNDSLASRFSVGSIMEVVDKNRISQVKVASVLDIVGKRLHVKYYDSTPEDGGFWCHEDSPLIHPVGWAFRVGHPLDAPQNYCERVAAGRMLPNDSTPDMFYQYPLNEPPWFVEGVKLEAIDPLNLSAVCAATVMQILNEGYMMIRIDCYPPDASGGDWFCYHQRSPCIFPVGFALANNIPLVPPHGFTPADFTWDTYLTLTGSSAANRSCFAARGHVVSHGFVAGMRLECADLMDPRLVCVATIARVVADLLKVHFDGWGAEYDQWLWAHSTDMYPVGWCRAVGHRLEGPLQPAPRVLRRLPVKPTRRKRRQQPKAASQPPNTTEDSSQNSDMGDKSISPPTSVSEMSADAESRHEDPTRMDVDPPTNGLGRIENIRVKEEIMNIPLLLPSESSDDGKEMQHEEPPEEPGFHIETNGFSTEIPEYPEEPMEFLEGTSEFLGGNTESMGENTQFTEENAKLTGHSTEFAGQSTGFSGEATEFTGEATEFTGQATEFTGQATEFTGQTTEFTGQATGFTGQATEFTGQATEFTGQTTEFTGQATEYTGLPNEFRGDPTEFPGCTTDPESDFTGETAVLTEESTEFLDKPNDKVIPRLVNTSVPLDVLNSVEPENWTTADVAKFLTVNDCQPYCVNFAHITGPMMLQLTKDEIIELLEMKVGPSLKIFDLIQQLKCKIKQPQSRFKL